MSEPREQGYTSPLQEDRTSDRPRRERQQADPDQRRVVVFVDMLGFAALTEKWALEPRRLVEGSRSFSFGYSDEVLTSGKSSGLNAFVSFHNSIEVAITFARMARPLTAVTFSDSVFIATAYPIRRHGAGCGLPPRPEGPLAGPAAAHRNRARLIRRD